MTKNYMLQINGFIKRKKKGSIQIRDNKIEIDFVLAAQKHRRYLKDVKVISEELQHGLVVTGVFKKMMKRK